MKKQPSRSPGRSMLGHSLAAALSIVTGLSLLGPVHAQQWTLTPELRVGYEYDDNANLRSEPTEIQEIDGYILEGMLGIGYATQRTTLEFTPRLRSRVYDETPDVDSDDQFANLSFTHETLKSQFGIRSNYSREAVRTAERTDDDLDEDDPNQIPTDDSGVIFGEERRNRFRIAPRWAYNFTERTSFGIEYQYMDVTYDDAPVVTHVDYTDHRLGGVLSRAFTQRTRGYIAAFGRQYENELGTNDVDGIGAGVGFETDLSETTRLQMEVGYEDTEQSETGESDSNWVGNFNVVRSLETVTLLAQYRRSISAGGAGRVTARDSVNLNLKKQFTERVAGGVGVRAYHTEPVGDESLTVLQDRDFVRFFGKLEVALSRAFLLAGEYRYDRVDRSGLEGTGDSNNVILWLVYRPTPIVN